MEWSRGPIIGRGSTATVSLATELRSGELFAVKSSELSASEFLRKEQSMLSKLSCPRIVKYLGSSVSCENNVALYNLCIEYVAGGSISDAIRRRGSQGKLMEESLIVSYTRQILQGLDHLHGNGLVHCDIKSQNILIGEDGAKIADFGCAKFVGVDGKGGSATSDFSGTPVFMAPEVARQEEQVFAADIWALGCTVIEMATGKCPWPEVTDPVSALYRIGFSGDVPPFPGWISDEGKDFLSKCLRRNAKQRWTAKQLLSHPFVSGSLGSHSHIVEEFTTISPKSVLDQELWNSLHEFESPQRPTIQQGSSSSVLNSPIERIKMLIGGAFCSPQNVPNWSLDQTWFTVRCNIESESRQCFTDKNSDMFFADESILASSSSTMDCIVYEEEELAESSMSNEELPSDYSFQIVSTPISNESYFLCKNVEVNFVSENIQIVTDCNRICFVQSRRYLSICFSPRLYYLNSSIDLFTFHKHFSSLIIPFHMLLISFNFVRSIGNWLIAKD